MSNGTTVFNKENLFVFLEKTEHPRTKYSQEVCEEMKKIHGNHYSTVRSQDLHYLGISQVSKQKKEGKKKVKEGGSSA